MGGWAASAPCGQPPACAAATQSSPQPSPPAQPTSCSCCMTPAGSSRAVDSSTPSAGAGRQRVGAEVGGHIRRHTPCWPPPAPNRASIPAHAPAPINTLTATGVASHCPRYTWGQEGRGDRVPVWYAAQTRKHQERQDSNAPPCQAQQPNARASPAQSCRAQSGAPAGWRPRAPASAAPPHPVRCRLQCCCLARAVRAETPAAWQSGSAAGRSPTSEAGCCCRPVEPRPPRPQQW